MVVKILGISGSPIKGGNTDTFLNESLKAAESTGDVETELITLAGKDIKDCRHCNWCLKKQTEGKFCAQSDGMTEIYPRLLEVDALILASPVYIARLSGYLACFLDRLRVFGHGNLYHGKLENKVGGAMAVGWSRNFGLETTLVCLASAILGMDMIMVAPRSIIGSPLGAVGLASENGTGRFDPGDKLGILQDEYGLKGATALGKRVAEIAKLIKIGSELSAKQK